MVIYDSIHKTLHIPEPDGRPGKGRDEVFAEGYRDGYHKGWNDGTGYCRDLTFQMGFDDGYARGYEDAPCDQ